MVGTAVGTSVVGVPGPVVGTSVVGTSVVGVPGSAVGPTVVGTSVEVPGLTTTRAGSEEAELLLASRAEAVLSIRVSGATSLLTRTWMVIEAGLFFCTLTVHVTVLPLGVQEPLLAVAPSTVTWLGTLSVTVAEIRVSLVLNTEIA